MPVENGRVDVDTPENDDRDDLEEFIAECVNADPGFPAMVEATLQRRLEAHAQVVQNGSGASNQTDEEETADAEPTSTQSTTHSNE